jgi:hypothetical protein
MRRPPPREVLEELTRLGLSTTSASRGSTSAPMSRRYSAASPCSTVTRPAKHPQRGRDVERGPRAASLTEARGGRALADLDFLDPQEVGQLRLVGLYFLLASGPRARPDTERGESEKRQTEPTQDSHDPDTRRRGNRVRPASNRSALRRLDALRATVVRRTKRIGYAAASSCSRRALKTFGGTRRWSSD